MAGLSNIGITQGDLAWLEEETNQFIGLPTFKTELSTKYSVTQKSIEEEGYHLKCNVVFCLFLATVAASCATWLFLTQGHGGYLSGVCLSIIAAGFVATIVVMVLLTMHRKKNFENQFEEKASTPTSTSIILNAMEQKEVSADTIQKIVSHLEQSKRIAFLSDAYTTYEAKSELSQDQEKVFQALLSEAELLELIPQKDRAFALTILKYADQNSSENLFNALINAIGIPQTVEECKLLVKCTQAVQGVLKYSDTLEEREALAYRLSILKYMEADTPPSAAQMLFSIPETLEEALIFAVHPIAAQEYAKEVSGRIFAIRMLKLLPEDSEPTLLEKLMIIAGAPEETVLPIYNRHPKALSQALSNNKEFNRAYLGEDGVTDPKKLARLAFEHPERFSPAVVFSTFSKISLQDQIKFMQLLDSDPTGTTADLSKAIIVFILQEMLTKEYVDEYKDIQEYNIPPEFKVLLGQLGRWPQLVANRIFVTNFGAQNSLLKHPRFVKIFFESMEGKNKTKCIHLAAVALSQHKEGVSKCKEWLFLNPLPEWQREILLVAPDLVAKAECCIENENSILRVKELVDSMDEAYRVIYEKQLMIYFLNHYEKMVFEEQKGSELLTARLIERQRYLLSHRDWVTDFPKEAKRYIALFVNANIDDPELHKNLLSEQKDLFEMYTVTFNELKTEIPAYRLAALSPVLQGHLRSGMKGKGENIIYLDDSAFDPEVIEIFLGYLKTNHLQGQEMDILSLSYLAHYYQLGHLSSLCTLHIRASVNIDNFSAILETAVDQNLWELKILCLDFISKNRQNQTIIDYAKNTEINFTNDPKLGSAIKQFIHFGLNCTKLGIELSYHSPKETIVESGCGKLLSIPMGHRHVHLNKPLQIGQMDLLNQSVSPTQWTTQSPGIALRSALILDKGHTKKLEEYECELKKYQNCQDGSIINPITPPYPTLMSIFLQCAEETLIGDIPHFSLDDTLSIYRMAVRNQKLHLANTYFDIIKQYLNEDNLEEILGSAHEHQLLDLKLLSLIFVSQHSKDEAIMTLKEALTFDDVKGKMSTDFAKKAHEMKHTIEFGIELANEGMEITYENEELHVTITHYTESAKGKEGNMDKVNNLLKELSKTKPITHLHAEHIQTVNLIRAETTFLGKIIVSQLEPPQPAPRG